MWRILDAIGRLCVLPLGFGVFLLLLFLVYCVVFAWLSLFPIFSGHFRIMCNVWFLGLRVVTNKKVWKLAGIGILFKFIASIFT